MALTTLERVKNRDPGLSSIKSGSPDEASINSLILVVSASVADYLRRITQTSAQVETFSVQDGVQVFLLSAYPVALSPAPVVSNDIDRVFSTPLDSVFYYVDRDKGILYVDRTTLAPGPGVLRVSYTGGMATSTDAFVAAFPAIADVVESEVSRVFRLRGAHVDLSNEAGAGGSVTRLDSGQFSRWARQQLAPYVKELNV